MAMKKQAGFTMIELVIVIVILGILAATALPRFMDLTDEAEDAAVAGFAGALGSGVSMARALWLAQGQSGTSINLDGDVITLNASGWPSVCAEAVNVLQNDMTTDFTVGGTAPNCTYAYTRNTSKGIAYNANTGAVTISN